MSDNNKQEKKEKIGRKPNILVAAACIGLMCATLTYVSIVLELGGAMQLVVLGFAVFIAFIGVLHGHKIAKIESAAMASIARGLGAILILLFIGVLIGIWMAAGTIPTLIYYGLKIIAPEAFLFTACLVCCIGSVATGSSWTTGATFGIAIFGIGSAMGIPPAMTVGAIASGAYFGDKVSPLSETTNLAAAITGVNLFTHIRSMMCSSGFAIGLALIIYLILGFVYTGDTSANSFAGVDIMINGMKDNFNIGIITLIPPVIIVIGALKKVPALAVMSVSIFAAALLAIFAQGFSIGEVISFMQSGFSMDTGMPEVNSLLNRGGYESMWWVVIFTMVTLSIGGVLEETKMIQVILEKLGKLCNTQGMLILTHTLTSLMVTIGTTSQTLAIALPGRMYLPAYEKLRIKPEVCSRVCEDSGTIAAMLIPWGGCAIYFTGLYGVPMVEASIWAVFIWASPLVTVLLGFFNKFIFKYTDEEYAELQENKNTAIL